MRQTHRRPSDLAPGDRILIGGQIHGDGLMRVPGDAPPVMTLATVTGRGGDILHVEDAAGTRIQIHGPSLAEYHADDQLHPFGGGIVWRRDIPARRIVLWSDALPTGDPADVLAYATGILTSLDRHGDKGIVLHVTSLDQDVVHADLVSYGGSLAMHEVVPDLDRLTPSHEGNAFPGEIVGNAAFWGQELRVTKGGIMAGAMIGDLIVASSFRAAHADGMSTITLDRPTLVANFPTREDVGSFIPWSAGGDRYAPARDPWLDLYGPSTPMDVEMELQRGIARSEPDEVLVLVYDDGGGDVAYHCMGHTGIALLECDDIADYLHDSGMEPGLWMYRKARWWTYTSREGEHDAGIEGDWEPATADDVASFGFDEATMDREIVDVLEIDMQPGMTARYLELAKVAAGSPPIPIPDMATS